MTCKVFYTCLCFSLQLKGKGFSGSFTIGKLPNESKKVRLKALHGVMKAPSYWV